MADAFCLRATLSGRLHAVADVLSFAPRNLSSQAQPSGQASVDSGELPAEDQRMLCDDTGMENPRSHR
jgi:hypothetical protein